MFQNLILEDSDLNKKATTYLVLALTVIIWGIVIYRFKKPYRDKFIVEESLGTPIPSEVLTKEESNLELNMSFIDPFDYRGVSVKSRTQTRPKLVAQTRNKKIKEEKVKRPWPDVHYKGNLRNRTSGEELIIIEISGKSFTCIEGEEIGGISIVKTYRDSIKCKLDGETRVYLKNK